MDTLMRVFSGGVLSNVLGMIPGGVFVNHLALGGADAEGELTGLGFPGFSYAFPAYFLCGTLWPRGGPDIRIFVWGFFCSGFAWFCRGESDVCSGFRGGRFLNRPIERRHWGRCSL